MVTCILRSILVLLSVFAVKSAGNWIFQCRAGVDNGSCIFWAGFAGYDASYAEFPLVVGRTGMLGTLVGMDQKDRYAARCFTVAVLGHAGDMPVVVNNRCLGFHSAEKLEVPQLPFFSGRRYPCRGAEADSHGLPARKTMETPQLQYFSWWSMPLLSRSCLDMLVDAPVVFNDMCRGPDSGTAAAVLTVSSTFPVVAQGHIHMVLVRFPVAVHMIVDVLLC